MTKTTIKSWISRASEIDAQMKDMKKELDELKKKIVSEVVDEKEVNDRMMHGEKIGAISLSGTNNTKVTISFVPTFTEISFDSALSALTNQGKEESIDSVVKVQVTAMNKIIGADCVAELRELKGFSKRISF